MKPEAQTDKRIVSKGEYAKALAKRLGFGVSMFIELGLALLFAVSALYVLYALVRWFTSHKEEVTMPIVLPVSIFIVLLGVATCVFAIGCRNSWRKAKKLGNIQPLTRANIADLPAPDSLVRASQEPVQAQEAVLLRAATGEMPEEAGKLLRATAGGQEG